MSVHILTAYLPGNFPPGYVVVWVVKEQGAVKIKNDAVITHGVSSGKNSNLACEI